MNSWEFIALFSSKPLSVKSRHKLQDFSNFFVIQDLLICSAEDNVSQSRNQTQVITKRF